MSVLVLKIDVDTYRGTLEGVPNLVRILRQLDAGATFLFSLGKDHTGWALRRVFRPGFFQKVSRTSVVEHYGYKTLMYGTLLPAPDIGTRCADILRSVKQSGFECGIHTWDHVVWQDGVRHWDATRTRASLENASRRYREIFDCAAPTHGAAGWQMNAEAFRYLDDVGMAYASDGRAALTETGTLLNENAGPYRLDIDGQPLHCAQMPTTLPTLDELLGRTIGGQVITVDNVAAHLLSLTKQPRDHIYTLHAELEAQKLAPVFEQLLAGWREQGYTLISMADYHARLDIDALPVNTLHWGSVPGRSGDLILS